MTLISCQIRESGGQPLLRLSCSDNGVNWTLTCGLSLEYSLNGREQIEIMFYDTVCYGMAKHHISCYGSAICSSVLYSLVALNKLV